MATRKIYIILTVIISLSLENKPASPQDYDQMVIADHPVAFWNDGSGKDLFKRLDGILLNGPSKTRLPNGDEASVFNGIDQCMEITSDPALSISTAKVLTIETWLRPDDLDFQHTEGSGYVYWMGKGSAGKQEYAARMYGAHPMGHDNDRPNRISGYVFNNDGGLGAGSYFQAPSDWPISKAEWMHYVLIINIHSSAFSSKYPTGYTKLYLTRKSSNADLSINKDQDALIKYAIVPVAGNAPLRFGTRDFASYFKGAIGKMAIYNYELNENEILKHSKKMFNIK